MFSNNNWTSLVSKGRLLNIYSGKCLPSHITLPDAYDKDQESYPSKSEGKDESLLGK